MRDLASILYHCLHPRLELLIIFSLFTSLCFWLSFRRREVLNETQTIQRWRLETGSDIYFWVRRFCPVSPPSPVFRATPSRQTDRQLKFGLGTDGWYLRWSRWQQHTHTHTHTHKHTHTHTHTHTHHLPFPKKPRSIHFLQARKALYRECVCACVCVCVRVCVPLNLGLRYKYW